MKAYQDPSCLFATPVQPDRSTVYSPPEEIVSSESSSERPPLPTPSHPRPNFKKDQAQQTSPAVKPTIVEPEKKWYENYFLVILVAWFLLSYSKCKDLPTAFHTIFGTTLFLFGNLIAQDPSLVLQGEPSTPTPYWLSAIDVFHIGDNLPIRISGRGCPNAPEDWRMAVVWGRTLVNLADEILTRQKTPSTPVPTPMFHSPTFDPRYAFTSVFLPPTNSADEPKWPSDSPFALIATRHPPSSFRINLNVFTPHELLQLAQDQFSRGIFHMPHPRGTEVSTHFWVWDSGDQRVHLRLTFIRRSSQTSTFPLISRQYFLPRQGALYDWLRSPTPCRKARHTFGAVSLGKMGRWYL
jgi:hypothetical protein